MSTEELLIKSNGQWELYKSDDSKIAAYHSTNSEKFDKFNIGQSAHGKGVWASVDPWTDKDKNTAEVHLNIKNPIKSYIFNKDEKDAFFNKWKKHIDANPKDVHLKSLYDAQNQEETSDISSHILQEADGNFKQQDSFINMLKDWGHDSIANMDMDDEDKIHHYHIFDPKNVKINKWL